jgi:hypothetical protein
MRCDNAGINGWGFRQHIGRRMVGPKRISSSSSSARTAVRCEREQKWTVKSRFALVHLGSRDSRNVLGPRHRLSTASRLA